MYKYPLTLTFPLISITPQFQATDSTGKALFTAAKKLISSKEEIDVTSGGQSFFKIVSQENKITEIPSNWDILDRAGKTLGVIDDDFLSAIDTSQFISNPMMRSLTEFELSRAFNLRALKMYWIKNTAGEQIGFIAPDQTSLYMQQLPLQDVVRKLPFFYRFINPRYYVRLHNETVFIVEKQRTLLQDTYTIKAEGNVTDQNEPLLLNSIILAVLYERAQLKFLYGG